MTNLGQIILVGDEAGAELTVSEHLHADEIGDVFGLS